jgi:hypothetical protein
LLLTRHHAMGGEGAGSVDCEQLRSEPVLRKAADAVRAAGEESLLRVEAECFALLVHRARDARPESCGEYDIFG